MKCIVLLGLVMLSLQSFASRGITSVELHQSNPSTLVAALKAHISPPSSISVYQNRLIIHATDAQTKQLKAIIKQLDRETKTLFIAIKTANSAQQYQRQTTVKPSIRYNNNSLPSTSELRVTLTQKHLNSANTQSQGIRTVEGAQTWISTGQSKAFVTSQDSGNNSQGWANASTGFYATAFIQGQSVRINLQQSQQQFTGKSILTSQQLQTTIHGPLNQWLLAGYIYQQHQNQQQASFTLGSKKQNQGQSIPVYLKVSQ